MVLQQKFLFKLLKNLYIKILLFDYEFFNFLQCYVWRLKLSKETATGGFF